MNKMVGSLPTPPQPTSLPQPSKNPFKTSKIISTPFKPTSINKTSLFNPSMIKPKPSLEKNLEKNSHLSEHKSKKTKKSKTTNLISSHENNKPFSASLPKSSITPPIIITMTTTPPKKSTHQSPSHKMTKSSPLILPKMTPQAKKNSTTPPIQPNHLKTSQNQSFPNLPTFTPSKNLQITTTQKSKTIPKCQALQGATPEAKSPIQLLTPSKKDKKHPVHTSLTVNVNNKTFNTKKYTQFAKYINEVNYTPKSKIEKHLYRLRNNLIQKNNSKRTPHSYKTTNVVYCLYSNKKHIKKLYIGQISNSVFSRLLQHINTHDNTPIHNYIQKHGANNFKVFVLKQVSKHKSLLKIERYWILKLQTQINLKNPDKLNYLPKNYVSRTQQPPKPNITTNKENK
jgi:hypothetical protein